MDVPPLLSAERLAPVVRRALDVREAWPVDWVCEPIEADLVNPATAGLFTVAGVAAVGPHETRSWRVVLKVVHDVDLTGTPLESGYMREPADWNYWKREVLARRDGYPRDIEPLRPVTCLGTEDVDDTTAWLWLEELDADSHDSLWSLPQLADGAHDLGAFAAQGVPFVNEVRALPYAAHQWLGGWFATARAMGADHVLGHDECWTRPLVRDRLPVGARASYTAFMDAAQELLTRLEELPATVTHHDAQWSNFFRGRGEGTRGTIAIDWSFLGAAPVGVDLGIYVASNVVNRAVAPANADEHQRSATEAYLEGLRSYGWLGDESDVRLAAASAGALKMVPFLADHLAWLCPEFGEVEPWPEQLAEGQSASIDKVMDDWCAAFGFMLLTGERAVQLVRRG